MADPQVDAVVVLQDIVMWLRVVADELVRLNELMEHEVLPVIRPVTLEEVMAVPA